MSTPDCSNFATTNPDISGIGVRISFYLQTFLLVLLVDRSWQDAAISLWTFIATSFGLVIAAIVNRKELTFLQALQVSNLVWLANFGTFVALASYSRQKAASHHRRRHKQVIPDHDYGVKYGALLQTILSMILTLYMWASAPTFGPNSECSHLVSYVLFVVRLPALGSGRIVGLTVSSILTAGYLLITIHELKSYRRNRKRLADKKKTAENCQSDPEMQLDSSRKLQHNDSSQSTITIPSPSLLRPIEISPRLTAARNESEGPLSPASVERRRPRRRRWSFDLDPMFIGVFICQLLVFIYFIVSSELLLRYNKDADENDDQRNSFAFGQILALVVVLPALFSLVGAFQDNGLRRLSKKKSRKPIRKAISKRQGSTI